MVELTDLKNGKYSLVENKLYFDCGKIKIVIDNKSALEIMTTLLDSMNLLTKENEDLIEEIESRIENG